MSLLKDAILTIVFHFHIVQKLQPQIFQLVSIVLEQIEIVSNCRQYLIKFSLELATIILGRKLHNLLLYVLSFSLLILDHLRLLLLQLIHETIFLCIFIQFIFDCSYNALNF